MNEAKLKAALERVIAGDPAVDSNTSLDDKERIRRRYASRRRAYTLAFVRSVSSRRLRMLCEKFADGNEVDPGKIDPVLEPIRGGTFEGQLFRLATCLWSVPPSQGFGRRTRFLVWDKSIEKLIGVIALGDPVFNLSDRDQWIGWSAADRKRGIRRVADAYTLGAVPPYAQILGGKLVASLVASNEIVTYIHLKYARRQSIILERGFDAPVLFTTTSALGRSSLYNRLKAQGRDLYRPIGWTAGFGHFQIPNDMFVQLREFLRGKRHSYADGHAFGTGPNWRMRVIRAAVSELGFDDDQLLNHGVKRQIYAVPLAENFRELLRGSLDTPQWITEPLETRAAHALRRWVGPRAERDQRFKSWTRSDILVALARGLDTECTRREV